jgi:hypothetical protein
MNGGSTQSVDTRSVKGGSSESIDNNLGSKSSGDISKGGSLGGTPS